ncbi:hypothetical protein BDY19DRAFT_907248 [Irpex rosettiformis]|uniref:Uncharacterized protein n=1 Tax=Irpex rosettiformis TaxID=378272 RepID=A0ACB8U0Q9_9APHY|nr:hypothetical protein BDY19DRAFT_907248 [Irpex rosettiformis]
MSRYGLIAFFVYSLLSSVSAAPIYMREVPQEHSHEAQLRAVRTLLQTNNPNQIQDPVFGLLGNAAAAAGAGKITDLDCLQMFTADQAFTNAKAAGDVEGMTNALIFRAIERNTGKVGLASATCTQTATNPEIAAISQHQDPASSGAAATNKAITLELAKQIASIGGNPQDALKSGTFKPGDVNDATAKGNTCDDANDAQGCIFSQNLIVNDATADEINAAVAGVSASSGSNNASGGAAAAGTSSSECATVTVTVTPDAAAAAATTTAAAAATTTAAAAASGSNLQTFTGALGGLTAPAVTTGGRGFVVQGSDDFLNSAAALGRSCDIQHNQCANKANSGGGFTVGACDQQNNQCHAAI